MLPSEVSQRDLRLLSGPLSGALALPSGGPGGCSCGGSCGGGGPEWPGKVGEDSADPASMGCDISPGRSGSCLVLPVDMVAVPTGGVNLQWLSVLRTPVQRLAH